MDNAIFTSKISVPHDIVAIERGLCSALVVLGT
jgi:hypothetical protein